MIQPEPINARFVGGPLDGETHVLAHRLPYVQVPGPDETFFARLWIEKPEEAAAHLLYAVEGADDGETLVYRSLEDGEVVPAAGVIAADGSVTAAPDDGPSAA